MSFMSRIKDWEFYLFVLDWKKLRKNRFVFFFIVWSVMMKYNKKIVLNNREAFMIVANTCRPAIGLVLKQLK